MKKLSYTPGPWQIEQYSSAFVVHNGGPGLATVYKEANACLIAAAPDLLDAVLMLLGCTDLNADSLDDTSIEAIKHAQTALAKAQGGKT